MGPEFARTEACGSGACETSLIRSRDIVGDVGREIGTPAEYQREDAWSVAVAAGKRLSEALRVVERYEDQPVGLADAVDGPAELPLGHLAGALLEGVDGRGQLPHHAQDHHGGEHEEHQEEDEGRAQRAGDAGATATVAGVEGDHLADLAVASVDVLVAAQHAAFLQHQADERLRYTGGPLLFQPGDV